jgi:hypothetical protein
MIFIHKLRVQIVNKPRSPRSENIPYIWLLPPPHPIVSRFQLPLSFISLKDYVLTGQKRYIICSHFCQLIPFCWLFHLLAKAESKASEPGINDLLLKTPVVKHLTFACNDDIARKDSALHYSRKVYSTALT